jgi:hypothetical protein
MDVKGKTLCLYLALDPTELAGTKYIVSSVKGDYPTLIKIKGERKKKHAIELISMLMNKQGLVRIEREAEDYRLPYEETEALIERGLIKVILPKGETLDSDTELVKADLSGLKSMRKDSEENVSESEQPIEEIDGQSAYNTPEAEDIGGEEKSTDTESEVYNALESVFDDVPENTAVAEIKLSDIESKGKLKAKINKIVKYSMSDSHASDPSRETATMPLSIRVGAERISFVFSGEDEGENLVALPYTREEYLSFTRRQRKESLMTFGAFLRYETIKRAITFISDGSSDDKKADGKIKKLKARLEAEAKLLSKYSLWSEVDRRVTK